MQPNKAPIYRKPCGQLLAAGLFLCLLISGFATTPLFIAGAVDVLTVFWLALVIGVLAVCYAVYLLYLDIPIVMGITQQYGFFSSAVLAFCMVILMMIMWDMGAAPSFTD
ncbi:MAG: hypothetical protein ACJAYG_000221 [Oceanicoccus sp.]